MTVTNYRLKVLTKIEELCKSGDTGFVTPKILSEEMQEPKGNIVVMLLRLEKIGWIEDPYHGCYRLSEEGRKILTGAIREED